MSALFDPLSTTLDNRPPSSSPEGFKSNTRISAALLKVASRCNLNCDYCYVYKHEDQSWRDQPHFMSEGTVLQFAERLNAYALSHQLSEFSVTFHGGEPLLYGVDRLVQAAQRIRSSVTPNCALEFSLQTNGTLLTDAAVEDLEKAKISVSLSLDGPRHANDLHRLDHSGESTFEDVLTAVRRLNGRESDIFRGVITVIDPRISPRELFEFFAPMRLPRLDLLLPDATHLHPPPGRDKKHNIYVEWLKTAFELWFREYSSLPLRWFDAILASRLGVPSPTDAMGFGAVSLIVIETDGSYTDHDVFKITQPNAATLHQKLEKHSFENVARHPHILEHEFRLTMEGLADECKTCPAVEACAGGSVMHRWHPARGLNAPTVYCAEIFHLVELASRLLQESLNLQTPRPKQSCLPVFKSGEALLDDCQRWRKETEARADQIASREAFRRGGVSAAAILLAERGGVPLNSFGFSEPRNFWLKTIKVQSDDPRLVTPFLDTIRVFSEDEEQVKYGLKVLDQIESRIHAFDPGLLRCIKVLISDIIFVESKLESEGNIFSFSDDSSPNVLYIAPYAGNIPVGADDLADSIIHEFLHHVLYHAERDGPMLFDKVYPRFPAPWRAGLRPSGGFFHGTFVFAGLSKYWSALAKSNSPFIDATKAQTNASRFRDNAIYGIKTLLSFALLTQRGQEFLAALAEDLAAPKADLSPPGILS